MPLPLQKLCFVIHLVHAVVSDILDEASAIKKTWEEFYLMLHILFSVPSSSGLRPNQPPVKWVLGLFPRGKETPSSF
jgi:hypothetical protein